MENNNNNKFKKSVPWYIFAWAMGVILILFGVAMTAAGNAIKKTEVLGVAQGKIEIDVGKIQTDVSWIREYIEKDDQKRSSFFNNN